MLDWMPAALPWLRALHLIAVISWMAGLLYLPRLFVYHCTAAPGSEMSETFKIMEDKLSRLIMFPAMVATVAIGVGMLFTPGYLASAGAWLWVKLLLVGGLLGMHALMVRWRNAFARDANPHPQRFFRIANEIPTLLMIGIVILVITKPF
jgi:putative membrane protein